MWNEAAVAMLQWPTYRKSIKTENNEHEIRIRKKNYEHLIKLLISYSQCSPQYQNK
jgi:hypothetical protein